MSTAQADRYALGRTPEEYERLRLQALIWEASTGRLLDEVGLAGGASCLDAGCGPGETMRLMAERVGPAGRVVGLDVDDSLGAVALERLHGAGHGQCAWHGHDITADAPIPGAPFDLVHARLLLFHLPDRVAVLARLWHAVAPGGHLVVQDYDVRAISVLPALASVEELTRVLIGAFTAAGADVSAGARLPRLFAQAGAGEPDGTDVAGRLEPFATGRVLLESGFRSVLPAALAHGVTTEADAAAILSALDRDAAGVPRPAHAVATHDRRLEAQGSGGGPRPGPRVSAGQLGAVIPIGRTVIVPLLKKPSPPSCTTPLIGSVAPV